MNTRKIFNYLFLREDIKSDQLRNALNLFKCYWYNRQPDNFTMVRHLYELQVVDELQEKQYNMIYVQFTITLEGFGTFDEMQYRIIVDNLMTWGDN